MIYTMPFNESIMNKLPPFPTEKERDRFIQLVTTGLTQRGYVLGPRAVFFGPMGEINVDADRDPRDDWVSFVMPTKTPQDQTEEDEIAMVLAALPKLKLGTLASGGNVQKVVGWLAEAELKRRGVSTG